MNLIDKDKLIESFEEECVGECACCRRSIRGTGECGLIADFDVEIKLVRCKDCRWFVDGICEKYGFAHPQGWFCADGEQK